ncbi:uncharacterized protein DUF742 [Actinocorallia herbida]|uniref:Uncharacterized protein DUF742 n=1 Tax=Actinocorallia herbida TaxID=58109 RepID=A0A3N1D2N3_9ACTN|nr:DUF742 domain-containing protein [Actinocorallia herbida]ROO87794.1 uncharacterized protein DUF742 [Actinocorallia herbida]
MTRPDDYWAIGDPGPLVRPFAMTRGRVGNNTHKLDILTLVTAVRTKADFSSFDREYEEILQLCQRSPISIAEISGKLNLLVAVTKVLVGDLINSGHLIFRSAPPSTERPDTSLLQAVLDGIREL